MVIALEVAHIAIEVKRITIVVKRIVMVHKGKCSVHRTMGKKITMALAKLIVEHIVVKLIKQTIKLVPILFELEATDIITKQPFDDYRAIIININLEEAGWAVVINVEPTTVVSEMVLAGEESDGRE